MGAITQEEYEGKKNQILNNKQNFRSGAFWIIVKSEKKVAINMPASEKQTYAYRKNASILYGLESEYKLSDREFVILYSFFYIFLLC